MRGWGGYDPEVRHQAATLAIALVRKGLSATGACDIVAGEVGCHRNSVKAWCREIDPTFGRAFRASEIPSQTRHLMEEVQRLRTHIKRQNQY